MATEVDICNLALARLGDTATVASISPPEGSAQAALCSRFYPIARKSLLTMHNWAFALQRATLAEVINPSISWQFAYAQPANCLKVISVIPSDALDDYQAAQIIISPPDLIFYGQTYPQQFSVETDGNGNNIILTNQEAAVARFLGDVTDTNLFAPLFVDALSWYLASMLAGPLMNGKEGASQGAACLKAMSGVLSEALKGDSSQQSFRMTHIPNHIGGR